MARSLKAPFLKTALSLLILMGEHRKIAFFDRGDSAADMYAAHISPCAFPSLRSRLSFPATGPRDPGTDFKAPGSLTHHRFRHLLKGFLEGVSKGF